MAVDKEEIRRHVREMLTEEREREADKRDRDELRSRLEKLEAKPAKPDHEAEPKDGDDHAFES